MTVNVRRAGRAAAHECASGSDRACARRWESRETPRAAAVHTRAVEKHDIASRLIEALYAGKLTERRNGVVVRDLTTVQAEYF